MRIAMVSEHANPLAAVGSVDAGGQNVHVAALAEHLARRGHDVVVHTRRDDAAPPSRIAAAGGYTVELVAAGPAAEVPKDELWQHMPAFSEQLARSWQRRPADVVHAHFWMSGAAALVAAAPLHLPVLQTFHALGSVKRRHQGAVDTSPVDRVGVEAELVREVARVVATCRDEVRELELLGGDPHRISIVPCGVDRELFTPVRGRRGTPRRLLVVGRLVERKGVGDVVTALAELPGVELVIAGGPARDALSLDPEVQRLRELARANGTIDRVRFVGRVSRTELPRLIASCDVVVAVPWYEPFGIVPLEAMACGRPVVGSAVGGLLDTVVPGVTGELVPPREPAALAAVLSGLLADGRRRQAYGEAGAARVDRRYRWERVAAATEAVYTAVRASRGASSMEVAR
ncbi:MAG: glycosyltransferase [Nocardioidaceae bacterium]